MALTLWYFWTVSSSSQSGQTPSVEAQETVCRELSRIDTGDMGKALAASAALELFFFLTSLLEYNCFPWCVSFCFMTK